ncbi:MAG: hypothetical protein PHH93_12625 [Prolixibacteraceae bacterium]|nr:hypothetical protein [Prolixibacteraceae bacterium]
MIIENKIESIFGRNASFAGYLFFITGLGLFFLKYFISGGLIIVGSAFVIFSFSGVEINTSKKKIRQYDKIFGLVKTGKWKSLSMYKGLTLIPFTKIESMASLSNRTTSNIETDYRIFLVNQLLKPAMAIKRCETLDDALCSIDELSIWLHLPVYSIKR